MVVFKNLLLGFLFGSLFATNGLLAIDKKRKRTVSSAVSDGDQKRKKQEECERAVSINYPFCLQQSDPELKGAHGFHCGYYALWHLRCLVKPEFFEKIKDRAALNAQFSEWEAFIFDNRNNAIQKGFIESLVGYFKKSFSSYTPDAVNNLTDGEIEKIIEKYDLKGNDQVTVIHAQNQLKELSHGVGLTDEVIHRIEKFRTIRLPHFFIINTANDSGSANAVLGHFILVALYWKGDECIFDVYDSLRPADRRSTLYASRRGMYRGFCQNIHNLFVEKNLDELRIHHACTIFADRVLYYLSQDLQDRQSWMFVRQCEEYFIQLLSIATTRDASLCQQKGSVFEKDAKAHLESLRETFSMNKDISIREGIVPEGYVDALCQLIQSTFDALAHELGTEIQNFLHKAFYSYRPSDFSEFALRVIIQAFNHACRVDTPLFRAIFIENFCSRGIEKQWIEAALH